MPYIWEIWTTNPNYLCGTILEAVYQLPVLTSVCMCYHLRCVRKGIQMDRASYQSFSCLKDTQFGM
jgi:hypothetical protein